MTAWHLLLWVALPYVAITVFIAGHIWRYRADQYGWTTRSTRCSRAANSSGAASSSTTGRSQQSADTCSAPRTGQRDRGNRNKRTLLPPALRSRGNACGCRLRRRIRDPRLAANYLSPRPRHHKPHGHRRLRPTGASDRTRDRRDDRPKHARRRLRLSRHRRSLVPQHHLPSPRPSKMIGVPIIYQMHATAAWLLLLVWPFTRLVHAWSIPLQYLGRPFILYRRRWSPAKQR